MDKYHNNLSVDSILHMTSDPSVRIKVNTIHKDGTYGVERINRKNTRDQRTRVGWTGMLLIKDWTVE